MRAIFRYLAAAEKRRNWRRSPEDLGSIIGRGIRITGATAKCEAIARSFESRLAAPLAEGYRTQESDAKPEGCPLPPFREESGEIAPQCSCGRCGERRLEWERVRGPGEFPAELYKRLPGVLEAQAALFTTVHQPDACPPGWPDCK